MKRKLISLLALPLIFTLGGCDQKPQGHEHTFKDEWSYNATSHWHDANCDHKEFTKDLGEHTFINGKCSVCGFDDPNYHPEIAETYYLPKKVSKFLGEIKAYTYDFVYDSDLRGYSEIVTEFNEDGSNDGYQKKVYKYNNDFSECTYQDYIANPTKGDEQPEWELMAQIECQYLENNSVIYKEYNVESDPITLNCIKAKYYNAHNQILLDYELTQNGVDGEVNEISHYYKYEYNEKGFKTKAESYKGIVDDNMYLDSYDEYEYDFEGNRRTIKYFYKNKGGEDFYQDGYALGEFYEFDNVFYFNQIEYSQDGEKGNHNKFGYNKNFESVYKYYGGLEEEEYIIKDENNKIVTYSSKAKDSTERIEYEYSIDGLLVKSHEHDFSLTFDCKYETTYTYSPSHQLMSANQEIFYPGLSNSLTANFEYTDIQSKELNEHVDIYKNIFSEFSGYVIVEGI